MCKNKEMIRQKNKKDEKVNCGTANISHPSHV